MSYSSLVHSCGQYYGPYTVFRKVKIACKCNFARLVCALKKQKEGDTKMSYIEKIKERARLDKKTIVLPESNDK